jgi:hypothetical protein
MLMNNVIFVSHSVANSHSMSRNTGSIQCAECVVAIPQLRRLYVEVKDAQSPHISTAQTYLYLEHPGIFDWAATVSIS